MNPLLTRLRHFWIGVLQSRYLVPASIVLFVLVFLTAGVIVYQNEQLLRQRYQEQVGRQQLRIADQVAANLGIRVNDLERELEVLDHMGPRIGRAAADDLLRATLLRVRQLGVAELVMPAMNLHFRASAGRVLPPDAAHHPDSTGLALVPQPDGAVIPFLRMDTPTSHDDHRVPYLWLDLQEFVRGVLAPLPATEEVRVWLLRDGRVLVGRAAAGTPLDSTGLGRAVMVHAAGGESLADRALTLRRGSGLVRLPGGGDEERMRQAAFRSVPLVEASGDWTLMLTSPAVDMPGGSRQTYIQRYAAIAAMLVGLFILGLLVAHYQQRQSRRFRSLVGEQDQIISSILTNSVDAIIVVDGDETIQMWNRGAQLIFGYAPEEILGQPISVLFPPDMDTDREYGRLRSMIRERGYVRDYITQRVTRDGRRITVDISRTPFQSPDGDFVGFTAIVKDVTEKTEVDQRMYNAEKLASIGLLASGVAHEINNPLSIIQGFAEMLKDRFEEGSQEYGDLVMIEENAEQARKIVEDLLGFSRASEGQEETADVAASVRRLAHFLENTKLAKHVELKLDIPEDLPPVRGDRRELQQVVLNLINNGVQALHGEKGRVTVRALRRDPRWVDIQVEDDGVGIPPEIRARIFDPFFTTKDVGEGTGLGLSLSYGIVKKWGGEISFDSITAEESPEGRHGTVFTVRLPVQVLNPEEPA